MTSEVFLCSTRWIKQIMHGLTRTCGHKINTFDMMMWFGLAEFWQVQSTELHCGDRILNINSNSRTWQTIEIIELTWDDLRTSGFKSTQKLPQPQPTSSIQWRSNLYHHNYGANDFRSLTKFPRFPRRSTTKRAKTKKCQRPKTQFTLFDPYAI